MPCSEILSVKYGVLRWCRFMGQGVLRVLGTVLCFWAKVGMTVPSEWKCVFQIKRQFCFLFNLLPESWVQFFSYFLGNLPRLCERKTKSFWYCMGETQISQLKLFKILFYFLNFFVIDRLLLSADVPLLFLNHISCDLTLNATLFWRVA